ncbi:MAG: MG2 domain-containing protein [Candidatus Aminicenantes bacterium]|nr:MG2 domain-containing protein [Candidatus Aminicenantes bacterium]
MKKLSVVLLVCAATLVLPACKKKQPAPQDWYRTISAYTSGSVSRASNIRVLFVNNVGSVAQPPSALEDVLEFSPALKGQAQWQSSRELVFKPEKGLQPGTEYKAVLQLGKILKMPKAMRRFTFRFFVIRQGLEILLDGLSPSPEEGKGLLVLGGVLNTADVAENAPAEKAIESFQEGMALSIDWRHDSDGRAHRFTVKNIARRDTDSQVVLRWNGASLGVDENGERVVPVPAEGEFRLLDVAAVLSEPRHIVARFSDKLKKSQRLEGLIRIPDHRPTFDIVDNTVLIYSDRTFYGPVTVTIEKGIRNDLDKRLETVAQREIVFERIRPAVRYVGRGSILPEKEKLTVPFEAVNLRSVQVTAFQVYANNMAQFFQLNTLEGDSELTRVGRYLWRKTVPLSEDPLTLGQWTRYGLDVTSLVKEHPGSLFRIYLSFHRGNSAFPCSDIDNAAPPVTEPPLEDKEDERYVDTSNWDYWQEESGGGRGDWGERDNPCKDAYYNPNINREARQGKNFIASNLGLIAKLDDNNNLTAVVTDIRTAEPISSARVKVFNYQNQLQAEGATDGSGFFSSPLPGRPFYLQAESGSEIGYLRVNADGALPLSHFDIGGERVNRGVKGVLYGERGVWRPGDTLYLTFVLYDRDKVLPKDHPVVLELSNSRGQLIRTASPTTSLNAFHSFVIPTEESAPTGNWKAKVLVGGLSFERQVKIETVVPNRLKISFDLGRTILTASEMPLDASLASQWLHGASAANLKAEVQVRFTARPTRFDRYQDYVFDDPTREFAGGEQNVFEGNLDANGQARVKVDLKVDEPSPGMLNAAFQTRVFEESGNYSSDVLSLPFHPYTNYVGLKTPKGDEARGMLLTDRDHPVDIVTIDARGNPVSRDKLNVYLYKIEWKWWWDKTAESLAEYASAERTQQLQSGTVATRNGVGAWKFQIKYPDWGRYLIRVEDPESGHAAGKIIYVDWPGWAGRAREEKGTGATRLNFTVDKDKYQVGDRAVVFLPEAAQGRALVSLENGSAVLRQMWVETQAGQNKFEFPITRDMTPNIYVHVTLLQPHTGKKSDTPIRLYGVVPVLVENPATRIAPQIQTADEFKPLEEIKVKISEKNGRPMTYTLAVVDEGLLGLTRYATPDLHKEFYAREALGVRSWDLFDDVAEAFGASLSRLLALGGDEAAAREKEGAKKRFPPVVLFEGPFVLEANATVSHVMKMPQYFGAVRVMVVGGGDGAFGLAEKTVPVRKDLMILPTLPRVARPGESFLMPVSVFVNNPSLKEVQVSVDTNELFQVEGEAKKTVLFKQPGDQIITFNAKTAAFLGQGSVVFKAQAGSNEAKETISIPVLSANAKTIQTVEAVVEPGRSWRQAIVPHGMANTNTVVVEISSVPPIDLGKRLDYLINYPHGCLEQTVSAAFPQLYLKNLIKLSEDQQKSVEKNVKAALGKLSGFKTPDGGFAFWPGAPRPDPWATNYAGHFMLEAARQGYFIPPALLEAWKSHQVQKANEWTAGDGRARLIQAFRLYTLSLAKSPDLGAMNRLREAEHLEAPALMELAAAYQMAGQKDAAEDLLGRCDYKVAPYREDGGTYGSDGRDKSILVRTLIELGHPDKAKSLINEVTRLLSEDAWLSTQETAYCLMAVSAVYAANPAQISKAALSWDDGAAEKIETGTPIVQRVYPDFPKAGKTLKVDNPSALPLYLTVITMGVPPAGEETESASQIQLQVGATDLDGNAVEIAEIEQGQDFLVTIEVVNPSRADYKNLVLTQIVPAGCQIQNPRFGLEALPIAPFDYQDVRDDRVYTYFDLKAGDKKIFKIALNASFNGRYYMPGVVVESMYNFSIHANSRGQWLEIIR